MDYLHGGSVLDTRSYSEEVKLVEHFSERVLFEYLVSGVAMVSDPSTIYDAVGFCFFCLYLRYMLLWTFHNLGLYTGTPRLYSRISNSAYMHYAHGSNRWR